MSINAFQLIPVLDKNALNNIKISCLEVCGKNLYIGTEDCKIYHFLLDETKNGGDQHMKIVCTKLGYKSFDFKKTIVQIKATTALKRVLVLCDGTLFLLNMLNLEPIQSNSKIKMVSVFAVNMNPVRSDPFSIELCIGSKRKSIQLYNVNEDGVTLTRELQLSDVPIDLKIHESVVCVALSQEYLMLNVLNGQVQDLFTFDQLHVTPIVTHIAQNEYLLNASNALGVFALSEGISTRPPLQWSTGVVGVVYMHPYILVLNDEFVTVHCILDQQQKQTIQFINGISIGHYEGRVFMATNQSVYCLWAVPVEVQIHHLLTDHRVSEALDLARNIHKTELSREQLQKMTSDIELQAAFMEFKVMNFNEASRLFRMTHLNPIQLIALYSKLLPQDTDPSTTTPTSSSSSTSTTSPTSTTTTTSPTTKTSPTTTTTTSTTTTPTLLNNVHMKHNTPDVYEMCGDDEDRIDKYERFLFEYLKEVVGYDSSSPFKQQQRGDAYFINTCLIKLVCKYNSAHLLSIINKSRDQYDVTGCVRFMRQYGRHHYAASALVKYQECGGGGGGGGGGGYEEQAVEIWKSLCTGELTDTTFPGFAYFLNVLSKMRNRDLIWKNVDWCMEVDEKLAVKIFMSKKPLLTSPPSKPGPPHLTRNDVIKSTTKSTTIINANKDDDDDDDDDDGVIKNGEVINFLEGKYDEALLLFLEYLVVHRGNKKGSYNTKLILLYLQLIMKEHELNKQQQQQQDAEDGEDVNFHSTDGYRTKLRNLLQRSTTFNVDLVLSKVKDTHLHHEEAILYGKLEQHDKALNILTQKMKDFWAAEEYCVSNSLGRSDEYKSNLFHALLDIYLKSSQLKDGQSEEDMTSYVVNLLMRHREAFDVNKVLDVLPTHWSFRQLSDYLIPAMSRCRFESEQSEIVKNLSKGENVLMRRDRMVLCRRSVRICEDTLCAVCSRPFKDPILVCHPPNNTITHIHCQYNFLSSSSSSSLSSSSASSSLSSSAVPTFRS